MRFNSQTYKSLNESISRLDEAPSSGVEGDYEGEMARSELKSLIANAQELLKMLGEDSEIEAWVQSKITKAADYVSSVRNYMVGDSVNEACWKGYTAKGTKLKGGRQVPNCVPVQEASPAWQRKEGKNPEGGLNKAGVASYRRANPGSKLQTAVTTKPSKLKPGSKSANRRKSFCSRMKGMKAKLTSAETARDPDSRINKSLRKWNC
jgi:hypothetical protein